jgi:hypothetical protein
VVERGVGERLSQKEQLEHRVPMLIGVFAAKGVLPLEFKPAHSVGDLLTLRLDELEQQADRKGRALQALADHFARGGSRAVVHTWTRTLPWGTV